MRKSTFTYNGKAGAIHYPDEVCFAYNPNHVIVMCEGLTDVSVFVGGYRIESVMANGYANISVERAMQVLFSEPESIRSVRASLIVAPTEKVNERGTLDRDEDAILVTAITCLWASVVPKDLMKNGIWKYDAEKNEYRRSIRWFKNFPTLVSVARFDNSVSIEARDNRVYTEFGFRPKIGAVDYSEVLPVSTHVGRSISVEDKKPFEKDESFVGSITVYPKDDNEIEPESPINPIDPGDPIIPIDPDFPAYPSDPDDPIIPDDPVDPDYPTTDPDNNESDEKGEKDESTEFMVVYFPNLGTFLARDADGTYRNVWGANGEYGHCTRYCKYYDLEEAGVAIRENEYEYEGKIARLNDDYSINADIFGNAMRNGIIDINPELQLSHATTWGEYRLSCSDKEAAITHKFYDLRIADAVLHLDIDNRTCGHFLRWIDNHGLAMCWLFDKGTKADKGSISGNKRVSSTSIDGTWYEWERSLGAETTETTKACATNLSQDEVQMICSLSSAVIVELYLGKNGNGKDVWIPIVMSSITVTNRETEAIQDVEVSWSQNINVPGL